MPGNATIAGAAPNEEAGLERERWGTRFERPEIERAYADWALQRALPFNRFGGLAGLAGWLVGGTVMAAIADEPFHGWFAAIGGLVLPSIVLAISTTYVRGLQRWVHATAAFACFVAGMVAVGVIAYELDALPRSLGGVVICVFMSFAILRIPPWMAITAVLPFAAFEQLLLIEAYRAGSLSADTLVLNSMGLAIALVLGVVLALLLDIVARGAYRQERIIDAQKLTIARERARSESLLKQELSHQVAERSRELGAVLARSDVTLDVRRLSPDERFDARYRIVSALGAGGMGAVYEVERLTDGATLALKAVVGEVSGASAARFAREAEIGARIHHPNLVSIVDVGVSAGVPFLVMELLRGGSLESQRGRFGDVRWALPILRQIAEGLAALHDAGVVHRDLKPANVLLAGEGTSTVAKISDFGISRFGALDDAASSIDPNAATVGPSAARRPSALTGTGMVMGTPLYMAPEAARGGRNVDAPADVFALGIIAYEMLTGRAPFAVPAVMLAMAEQLIPAAVPIDDARVPAALRSLVLDCLCGDPAKRPRVRALLAELP